ncbi:hypothetical protein C7M84_025595 [Penaeus vannamei]|uniref:Uncharacterized protein n=1 Tax=Penaeus vannamei TaxID=6689 RepID=A0A423TXU2_PENVA|nr:hypothetical protein C7M84_025595 [Penaeus vannamei]
MFSCSELNHGGEQRVGVCAVLRLTRARHRTKLYPVECAAAPLRGERANRHVRKPVDRKRSSPEIKADTRAVIRAGRRVRCHSPSAPERYYMKPTSLRARGQRQAGLGHAGRGGREGGRRRGRWRGREEREGSGRWREGGRRRRRRGEMERGEGRERKRKRERGEWKMKRGGGGGEGGGGEGEGEEGKRERGVEDGERGKEEEREWVKEGKERGSRERAKEREREEKRERGEWEMEGGGGGGEGGTKKRGEGVEDGEGEGGGEEWGEEGKGEEGVGEGEGRGRGRDRERGEWEMEGGGRRKERIATSFAAIKKPPQRRGSMFSHPKLPSASESFSSQSSAVISTVTLPASARVAQLKPLLGTGFLRLGNTPPSSLYPEIPLLPPRRNTPASSLYP